MKKLITPCTVAIGIALACTIYIAVLNQQARQESAELQRSINASHASTQQSLAQSQRMLDVTDKQIEINRSILDEIRAMAPVLPVIPVPDVKPKPRRIAQKRKAEPNVPPCEEIENVERFGTYQVRVKDIRCLSAKYKEVQ